MDSALIIPILGVVVAIGYFGLTGGFGSSSSTNQPTYGGKRKSRSSRNKQKRSSTSKKR